MSDILGESDGNLLFICEEELNFQTRDSNSDLPDTEQKCQPQHSNSAVYMSFICYD